MDEAGLDGALKRLVTGNSDPQVFIHGDTDAAFGKAVAVLDKARRLGISKVAIETQPKTAP